MSLIPNLGGVFASVSVYGQPPAGGTSPAPGPPPHAAGPSPGPQPPPPQPAYNYSGLFSLISFLLESTFTRIPLDWLPCWTGLFAAFYWLWPCCPFVLIGVRMQMRRRQWAKKRRRRKTVAVAQLWGSFARKSLLTSSRVAHRRVWFDNRFAQPGDAHRENFRSKFLPEAYRLCACDLLRGTRDWGVYRECCPSFLAVLVWLYLLTLIYCYGTPTISMGNFSRCCGSSERKLTFPRSAVVFSSSWLVRKELATNQQQS